MVTVKVGSQRVDNVELFIFDKDGTLIDLYRYWSCMIRFRADFISAELSLTAEENILLQSAMGMDIKNRRLKPEGPVGIKSRHVVMQSAEDCLSRIGYANSRALCKKVFDAVDEYSLGHLSQMVHPIDGVVSWFSQLKQAGCQIAIATSDLSQRARLAMETIDLIRQVDFIAGSDMVDRPKPDPQMVTIILEHLGIPPENAVMVGDSVSDMALGNNAGLKAAIGVLTGGQTSREMLSKHSCLVAPSIADIQIIGSKKPSVSE